MSEGSVSEGSVSEGSVSEGSGACSHHGNSAPSWLDTFPMNIFILETMASNSSTPPTGSVSLLLLSRPLLLYWESIWSSWEGVTSSQLSSKVSRAGKEGMKDQLQLSRGAELVTRETMRHCHVIGGRQHSNTGRH